jgi:Group II intron, maturase-specific domain
MSYRIHFNESLADAVPRIVCEQMDRAVAELTGPDPDVTKAIHQVRKRGKKIRGLLRLVRGSLLRKLKAVFQCYRSQPIGRVIAVINPILRGWVNYFAYGHSSRCFSFIQHWVEQKLRRHLSRARQRRGFGWKRWSRQCLYETLGVFRDYRVRYRPRTVAPA